MRLNELRPIWEMHGEYRHLTFDCPKCGDKTISSRLSIPTPPHPKAWNFTTTNDFDTLSITPSIDYEHTDCRSHFFITDGEIKMV